MRAADVTGTLLLVVALVLGIVAMFVPWMTVDQDRSTGTVEVIDARIWGETIGVGGGETHSWFESSPAGGPASYRQAYEDAYDGCGPCALIGMITFFAGLGAVLLSTVWVALSRGPDHGDWAGPLVAAILLGAGAGLFWFGFAAETAANQAAHEQIGASPLSSSVAIGLWLAFGAVAASLLAILPRSLAQQRRAATPVAAAPAAPAPAAPPRQPPPPVAPQAPPQPRAAAPVAAPPAAQAASAFRMKCPRCGVRFRAASDHNVDCPKCGLHKP